MSKELVAYHKDGGSSRQDTLVRQLCESPSYPKVCFYSKRVARHTPVGTRVLREPQVDSYPCLSVFWETHSAWTLSHLQNLLSVLPGKTIRAGGQWIVWTPPAPIPDEPA